MFLDLQYFSVGILHCFPVNLTVIFFTVQITQEGDAGNRDCVFCKEVEVSYNFAAG